MVARLTVEVRLGEEARLAVAVVACLAVAVVACLAEAEVACLVEAEVACLAEEARLLVVQVELAVALELLLGVVLCWDPILIVTHLGQTRTG